MTSADSRNDLHSSLDGHTPRQSKDHIDSDQNTETVHSQSDTDTSIGDVASEAEKSVHPEHEVDDHRHKGHIVSWESFSGPIPHPSLLEHYKAIDPRFMDFFLEETTAELKHRRAIEQTELELEKKKLRLNGMKSIKRNNALRIR